MPNLFGDVPGAGIAVASKVNKVAIPATAGNVVFTHTVPAGHTQQLIFGHITLTTDATAADRRVVVGLYDEADNMLIDIHAGATTPASQASQHIEFMQGVYRETAFIAGTLQVPIPINFVAPAGYKFKITVDGGVAGDSYIGNLMIEDRD